MRQPVGIASSCLSIAFILCLLSASGLAEEPPSPLAKPSDSTGKETMKPGQDGVVANGAYEYWAKFPIGTSTTQEEEITLYDGKQIHRTIVTNLVSRTNEQLKLSYAVTEKTTSFVDVPATLPATAVARVDTNSMTQGQEAISVQDQSVSSEWVRAVSLVDDMTTERTVWTSRDVPGGVVKETVIKKKGNEIVSSSTLKLVSFENPPTKAR